MRAPASSRLLCGLPCSLLRGLGAAALALGLGVAQAQVPPAAAPARVYPMGSQLGFANFGPGPSLQVNCVSYPLGPGLRVEDAHQRLVLRGQLPGLRGPAVFARDAMGNVFQVWMLAPGQAAPELARAPNRCLFQQY